MAYCPKCEVRLDDDLDECPDCGIGLVDRLADVAGGEAGPRDSMEEAFRAETVETVIVCPSCLVEFLEGAEHCGPCGQSRLERVTADGHQRLLTQNVMDDVRVEELVHDEGRVRLCDVPTPADVGWLVSMVESMGVDVTVGNDRTDAGLAPSRIGLYVQADQLENSRMLLPDPSEFEDDEDDEGGPRYETLLRQATGYAELQKFEYSMTLCARAVEMAPGKPGAYSVLGQALLKQGRYVQAAESFHHAVDRGAVEAGYLHAMASFLDDDGKVSYANPRADDGLRSLETFCATHPRSLGALQLLATARHARGDKGPARVALQRMAAANGYSLQVEGPYAKMWQELGDD